MRNGILAGVLLLLSVALLSTYSDTRTVTISLPPASENSSWSYEENGEGHLVEMAALSLEEGDEWHFRAEESGEVVLNFVDESDSSRYVTYYYLIDDQKQITGNPRGRYRDCLRKKRPEAFRTLFLRTKSGKWNRLQQKEMINNPTISCIYSFSPSFYGALQ